MDDEIPILVRMRVECTKCGHSEEDTYEFEMPIDEAQPTEERAAGTCPDCGAPGLDLFEPDSADAVVREAYTRRGTYRVPAVRWLPLRTPEPSRFKTRLDRFSSPPLTPEEIRIGKVYEEFLTAWST
jgi:hypothetical protein